jgi:protein-S-isoprenylcysteine O-methyltransferase Ste14
MVQEHIMNEGLFRIFAAAILLSSVSISFYFRRKADKETGEAISRKVDGNIMMTVIKIGGLILWLSPLAYLINPNWMTWSKIGLSESIRWVGVAIGIVCVVGIYWLFNSIGNNISPTSATRKEHQLVTSGPYRYVRHPLYTIAASMFISFGMAADNWFIISMGVLAFIVMAIRSSKEESNLIIKFGDEYREYMNRTGRFLPKPGK